MAKIFLIKCSQFEGALTTITFPLGLMSLASFIRHDSSHHDIEIYDMRIHHEDLDHLKAAVARFKPDIIGFSAITMEAKCMYEAARIIRESGFDGPTVAGGPHATSFPYETLECKDIDYLVIGEGEETFKDLVNVFESGKNPKKVPGIAYHEDGIVHFSHRRPFIKNLDALPFPSYDLVDVGEYSGYLSMSSSRTSRYMNIFTSRACPFRCVYCHSIFGKKFRSRSPENVLQEVMVLIDQYDVKRLEIVDDIFNWDLNRAKKILDLFHRESLPIELTFPNGLRCDRLDREFLEKLGRLNFSQISVAVETASPRIQRLIRKHLNLEKVKETINTCNDLRIYTAGFFMLGFPTETEEELRMTVDFAVKSKLHTALFFCVIPFKGTELYELALRHSKVGEGTSFDDFTYFRSSVNLSVVPDEVFFKIQKYANIKFMLRPTRIYRILRDYPNWSLFWPNFRNRIELFRGAGKGHVGSKGRIYRIKERTSVVDDVFECSLTVERESPNLS